MVVERSETPNGTLAVDDKEEAKETDHGEINGNDDKNDDAEDDNEVLLPEGRSARVETARSLLRKAVEGVKLGTVTPIIKRMVDDTTKRLALLDERLGEVADDALVDGVCTIAVLIDGGDLARATNVHRELMQTGAYEAELKWLLGVKRVIEIKQKTAAA
ncbi:hypothetical protein FBU59_002503 [Linderina macrospora]|uniref:Uncharacterized protein n=1 Tax=Linderina macrospora TaxID=4868 RepID=A0ACC1JB62_9FUNG|nr:hypothetical protein FBU59_002503 [Linderina macrospora]